MAKKNPKRKVVGMAGESSGERIYYTTKNSQNTTEKLKLRKYNPRTRKHEIFTETTKHLGRNEVKKRK